MAKGNGVRRLDPTVVAAVALLLMWAGTGLLPILPLFPAQLGDEGKVAPFWRDGSSLFGMTAAAATHEAHSRVAQASPWRAFGAMLGERVPLATRGSHVPRKGWKESPLAQAIMEWDDVEFRRRFRVSRGVFNMIVERLSASGHVWDNLCKDPRYRTPAWFKVGVTILHLAQGGTWWQTGFCSRVSEAVVLKWVTQTCAGIVEVLRPDYLRTPTSVEECNTDQQRFAERRGIANVGGAVDGTHVPWAPESEEHMEQFRNYKGWYSILVVAAVNSFYMFVDADVGRPGRMSDSTATQLSHFYIDVEGPRVLAWA